MKIFKSKLNRLKYLYKQQLLIINDKLIFNRKKYLLMKKHSVTHQVGTSQSFNSDFMHSCSRHNQIVNIV